MARRGGRVRLHPVVAASGAGPHGQPRAARQRLPATANCHYRGRSAAVQRRSTAQTAPFRAAQHRVQPTALSGDRDRAFFEDCVPDL